MQTVNDVEIRTIPKGRNFIRNKNIYFRSSFFNLFLGGKQNRLYANSSHK